MNTHESTIKQLPKELFPSLLLEIPQPPKQLFIRGTLPDLQNYFCLCVVGSRKYSSYGKQVVDELISGLSGYPFIIISGLALGIDALAHKAALDAGLLTVAIPGSGISDSALYPASHKGLADEICKKGGCLISEFEPTQKAAPWTFPQRNRIMAGMSHAVYVVEAEEKSGTLITSKLATEYNRDILTTPGSIFSSSSRGPHMLIRLGATPITKSEDILEHFSITTQKESLQKDYSDCSNEELCILQLLDESKEKHLLIEQSCLPVHIFNIHFTMLELKGFVKEELGLVRRV